MKFETFKIIQTLNTTNTQVFLDVNQVRITGNVRASNNIEKCARADNWDFEEDTTLMLWCIASEDQYYRKNKKQRKM